MRKWFRSGRILLALLVGVSLILAGCAGEVEKEKPKQTITIADKAYASATVSMKLIQIVIEDELGYPVDTPLLSWPVAWAGIAAGDVDVDPDVWYLNQKDSVDKYVVEQRVAEISLVYPDCLQGWVIPTYVAKEHGITTVQHLKDKAHLFDDDGDGIGDIYLGPAGWTSTEVDGIKVKSYGLNLTTHAQDEWVQLAHVRGKIDKHQPVVFSIYQPHWVFGMWDLTWIEEPEHSADLWQYTKGDLEGSYIACNWEPVDIYVGIRTKLRDEAPDVYKFLNNYKMDKEVVNALVMEIEDVPGNPAKDAETVCRQWLKDNPGVLTKWLTGVK